ncbi:hypothetical protein [Herbaspirillum sp. RV1423]|uniref:hypothetical protein n=1 Tax=Herbaspirillum sp. RV1423 TaxID=1443993 RepID=UPI00055114B8|nr:hypothetical protein [Herbaspirillum sp. RV1423]
MKLSTFIRTAVVAIASLGVLTACNKTEPLTTESATTVLADYYKTNKDICAYLGDFPVSVPTRELSPAITSIMTDGLPARLLALESVALVTRSNGSEASGGQFKVSTPVAKFDLTTEGKALYTMREQEVLGTTGGTKKVARNELCFATRALDSIVKVQEKPVDGKPDRAVITFKLKIEPRGSWGE